MATFSAASKTECTTTPAATGCATAPSVMKCTLSDPASCGHDAASPPPADSPFNALTMRVESVVGPATRPSAVVARATSSSAPSASRLASCSARSHRDSPLAVRVAIDHEESMTISVRPPDTDAAPERKAGRVTARASIRAIATVTMSDTARRMRSHSVSSRASSSTRRQSSSDGIGIRGGRSLTQEQPRGRRASAPSSSQRLPGGHRAEGHARNRPWRNALRMISSNGRSASART